MPRPAGPLLAILVALAALGAGGCAPAPSLLSDPRDILQAAALHLRQAHSVHVDATIDGSVRLDALAPGLPLGPPAGGTAGRLALTGTTAAGDLDLEHHLAALHLDVPALLGLTADVRQADHVYVRASLLTAGWHVADAEASSIVLLRTADWAAGMIEWLRDPGSVPTRLDDVSCPAGTCYVLRLRHAGPGDFPIAAGTGEQQRVPVALTVDLRIDRVSLRLSELVIAVDLGDVGQVDVAAVLSGWDASVAIEAPPAEQVVEEPLLH